ncbi:MAG: undecaprenyl/decaprenyl-phosphate alpha-N-acetylglucosaminyl 1-phosphate transferase [Deltaproteobacteria bacterium]|nr:undecaprenyl/decaprenyl-phosphate alpha-N-acetylglucosaminyl 1-phosphate transferase [Deltaproteobacteria bacterium]
MTWLAFTKHILFAFSLFAFSCVICLIIINRSNIMDVPNIRSSHDTPVPTAGGIAILTTFILGMLVIYFVGDKTIIGKKYFLGFLFSSILIAAMSLYDDYKERPYYLKLFNQIIAVILVMFVGIVVHEISLPWIGTVNLKGSGYVITFLWIIGLTNAFNFMDGINGMAGGTAVIAAIFFSIISFSQGSNFAYIVSYTIISGTLGFLVFNFPKARLFMGDVGSTFLGFSFASLAIIAALYDLSHTSLFVMPLLLFHFIYDTLFTFIRRFIRGKNVFEAHRSHLYQLFNQLGYGHTFVSIFYFTVGISQGFGAWWMVNIVGQQRVLVFIPYLIFQIIYSVIIIHHANKAGLITKRKVRK